jgi:hypothetical protein
VSLDDSYCVDQISEVRRIPCCNHIRIQTIPLQVKAGVVDADPC